ncbi:SpeB [uncultured Desulfobacterium sp.]|uniref:SpeB n=1 Tax=uncultured Desulfobacterium sp. TaxID=201089 RepID=A0A445MVR6_9BACT|nr:SpeB [uncultured Desulfobacterium sp.]
MNKRNNPIVIQNSTFKLNNSSFSGFLSSEIAPAPPESCLFHVIPVPYEKTVSYGTGTAAGPSAILNSSQQLELFDGESIPARYGIYTHAPVNCKGKAETALKRITDAVSNVLDLKKIPVLLGGEHTISVGAFRAVSAHFKDFGIVQFDAHADLRDTYHKTALSHACVMHRALDMDIPIYQIGIRSLSWEEHLLREERHIGHLDASAIGMAQVPDMILPDEFSKNIYITFDVDGLDPSIMPATGTPEPGGLNWHQAIAALASVLRGRHVIGLDVVELAPIPGMHAPDYTVARLIYNLFGMIGRQDRG